jgi:hypothetical protein
VMLANALPLVITGEKQAKEASYVVLQCRCADWPIRCKYHLLLGYRGVSEDIQSWTHLAKW